jgi:hypothetical protein
VLINDPGGVGLDNVNLGAGAGGNTVSFDHAGGSVSGTDGGVAANKVYQAADATANVTVNFLAGAGVVILGNGNDSVTANGANTFIVLGSGANRVTANGLDATVIAGNGADTVTANGVGATVNLGDGNDTVSANGDGALVVAGAGADVITANGIGAVVLVGNGNDTIAANGAGAIVVAGSGSDSISATGAGSAVQVTAGPGSVDTIIVGSNNNNLRVTGGIDTIFGAGGDTFLLNGLQPGSSITEVGSSNKTFLGGNASATLALNPAQVNNVVTVQALAPDGANTGAIEMQGFGAGDSLVLQSLTGGITHAALDSFAAVLANLVVGATNQTLVFDGGGYVRFATPVSFQASEFLFGTTSGPV